MAFFQQRIKIAGTELLPEFVRRVHQPDRRVISSSRSDLFQNRPSSRQSGAGKIVETERHDGAAVPQRHSSPVERTEHPASRRTQTGSHAHAGVPAIASCITTSITPSSGTSLCLENLSDETPSLVSISSIERSANTCPDGALRGVFR